MTRRAHNRMELDAEYIKRAYLSGISANSIAKELDVSKRTILRRLREQGVERRQANTFPEITKEVLQELYTESKLSTRDIAERYGCSSRLILKRLRKYGIPIRKHAGDPIFTKEERKMKWGRSREQHNLWKGGVTGINQVLRGAIDEWIFDRLKEQNFTCFISGKSTGDMQVHHETPFHKLRDRLVTEMGIELKPTIADYTEAEVETMRENMREIHEQEAGYVLTREVHSLFHSLYGFETTREDLLDFKRRYHSGEFDEKEAIV